MSLRPDSLARISIRQLQTFALVYELGSLVKAASRLAVTQPAVTKRLRELEADIGVELLRRVGRGVEPTAYGDALFGHATAVLSELRAAANDLNAIYDGDGGSIVIGVSPVAATLVARAIIQLKQKRPKINVRIETGSYEALHALLETGAIDMAVARFADGRHEKRMVRDALADEPLCLIVRPGRPALDLPSASLSDLMDFQWILPTADEVVRSEMDRVFRDAGLSLPESLVETTSISATREMIARGDAITISPRLIYLDDFEQNTFSVIPIDLPIRLNPIGITCRRLPALAPPAAALFDILKSTTDMTN
jgi:DNA-binding transcriptional LysR family regulator